MEFREPKACPQLDWGSLRSGFENVIKSRIQNYQSQNIFWLQVTRVAKK